MPGAIPSPFMPDMNVANSMMKELESVATKYGYTQLFIAVGKPTTSNMADWFSQSNGLSDGMVSCIKDSVEAMEKEIDRIKGNDR